MVNPTGTALVCASLLVLLSMAGATRTTPSLTDAGDLVLSPESRSELLSLIDPLEASSTPHCTPTGGDDDSFATHALAPYAASGRLLDGVGYHCHATCEGKPFGKDATECWGLFRWFCGSGSTCGVLGVKCDGHYTFYSDRDSGKAFAQCEGLLKYFNVRTASCPATGATSTRYIAAGCLGTGTSKMVRDAAPADTAAAAAKAAADATDGQTDTPTTSRFAVTGDSAGVLLGSQHGQLLAALAQMGGGSRTVEGDHTGVYEGKCEGLGGDVKGVKHVVPASTPPAEATGTDELEALAEAALSELGLPMPLFKASPTGPPQIDMPPASLIAALMGASKSKLDLGDGHHLDCEVTCNGRVPWLSGALPCWGKLDLVCESKAAPPPAGGAQASASALLHYAPAWEFEAACKGLWTGAVGKRCFGLTETHGVFESDQKDVEAWGLCTGKHGIGGHRSKEGYAMGSWCKGHSAKGVVVERHDASTPAAPKRTA